MKLKPMMIKILLTSSVFLFLTACVATEAIQKPTASGKPEQTFRLPANQVRTLIEAACNTNGMATEQSGNAVICSRERKGIVGNAAVSVAMRNIDYGHKGQMQTSKLLWAGESERANVVESDLFEFAQSGKQVEDGCTYCGGIASNAA